MEVERFEMIRSQTYVSGIDRVEVEPTVGEGMDGGWGHHTWDVMVQMCTLICLQDVNRGLELGRGPIQLPSLGGSVSVGR
jgi:hypothetical protein